MEYNYCPVCGTKVINKNLIVDGITKYCTHCKEYRFPLYSVAVSMIVVDTTTQSILLIQQYGKKDNILVAGYINRGESAKEAVIRELKEETNLIPVHITFNDSKFYEASETLMLNFVVEVNKNLVEINSEIDSYYWYSFEEAAQRIKKNSLAEYFLLKYLNNFND